jgi:hypothetical protein
MGEEEKRKHKRVPVTLDMLYMVKLPISVRMLTGGQERPAIAQDISEGGLALSTNFELPIDALLLLKFAITNDAVISNEERTHHFELDAQVCYCRPLDNGSWRLGVSFVNIVTSERLFISNYIWINALMRNTQK